MHTKVIKCLDNSFLYIEHHHHRLKSIVTWWSLGQPSLCCPSLHPFWNNIYSETTFLEHTIILIHLDTNFKKYTSPSAVVIITNILIGNEVYKSKLVLLFTNYWYLWIYELNECLLINIRLVILTWTFYVILQYTCFLKLKLRINKYHIYGCWHDPVDIFEVN